MYCYQCTLMKLKTVNWQDYSRWIWGFSIDDYVENPAALARINANITKEELAERMNVSQAYISKIESKDKVSDKALKKVLEACKALELN